MPAAVYFAMDARDDNVKKVRIDNGREISDAKHSAFSGGSAAGKGTGFSWRVR
jgi:hypothetical protein